tara:strand:+ start:754 stop:1560 length:807 start_codon:yes stop_codon:yes gene_type:complete
MSKKLVCTGASITVGYGWDLSDTDQVDSMWVNQLPKKINSFKNLEIINLGVTAQSNELIFESTINAIANYKQDIEMLLCSWVSCLRYHYSLGFELYATNDLFPRVLQQDLGLNSGTIPKDYVNNLKTRFFSLHHLHFEILKIIRYTNIISNLASSCNINVYHINDSCPWDQDFFVKQSGLPSAYTKFTQEEILNVNNRSDDEIYKLYDKMHNEYQAAGGIKKENWINLDQSFLSLSSDKNSDNRHPGKKSNNLYSDLVKHFLNSKNIF